MKNIPVKQVKKWVIALRSGKYKQSTHKLQNKKGYCCLGVACDIFIPKNKKQTDIDGILLGEFPKLQHYSPPWLKTINEVTGDKIGITLSRLNDQEKYSFNEIADVIELVYIHKAL